MKITKNPSGGATLTLEAGEVPLLRLAMERATFIDTPPGQQEEILRFADDVMKALAGGA